MQNSGGGMRKFLSVFSWGMKIFCLNFMEYEFFFGILEFHSAPVPRIKNDQSLTFIKTRPYQGFDYKKDRKMWRHGHDT